jgi:hypothetical protein
MPFGTQARHQYAEAAADGARQRDPDDGSRGFDLLIVVTQRQAAAGLVRFLVAVDVHIAIATAQRRREVPTSNVELVTNREAKRNVTAVRAARHVSQRAASRARCIGRVVDDASGHVRFERSVRGNATHRPALAEVAGEQGSADAIHFHIAASDEQRRVEVRLIAVVAQGNANHAGAEVVVGASRKAHGVVVEGVFTRRLVMVAKSIAALQEPADPALVRARGLLVGGCTSTESLPVAAHSQRSQSPADVRELPGRNLRRHHTLRGDLFTRHLLNRGEQLFAIRISQVPACYGLHALKQTRCFHHFIAAEEQVLLGTSQSQATFRAQRRAHALHSEARLPLQIGSAAPRVIHKIGEHTDLIHRLRLSPGCVRSASGERAVRHCSSECRVHRWSLVVGCR